MRIPFIHYRPIITKRTIIIVLLLLLIIALSFLWLQTSVNFFQKLRYETTVICKRPGCGGFLELGWINQLPVSTQLVVYTYGLPAVLFVTFDHLFLENFFENIVDFPWFIRFIVITVYYLLFPILIYLSWIAAGMLSALIPYLLVRMIRRGKMFGAVYDLVFLIMTMLLMMSIGFVNTAGRSSIHSLVVDEPDVLEKTRNIARTADLGIISSALERYIIDNNGNIPSGITPYDQPIASNGIDLCTTLTGKYIAQIPVDPLSKSANTHFSCYQYETGFTIRRDSGNQLIVTAPLTEKREPLTAVAAIMTPTPYIIKPALVYDPGTTKDIPTSWVRYVNPIYSYEFRYPPSNSLSYPQCSYGCNDAERERYIRLSVANPVKFGIIDIRFVRTLYPNEAPGDFFVTEASPIFSQILLDSIERFSTPYYSAYAFTVNTETDILEKNIYIVHNGQGFHIRFSGADLPYNKNLQLEDFDNFDKFKLIFDSLIFNDESTVIVTPSG